MTRYLSTGTTSDILGTTGTKTKRHRERTDAVDAPNDLTERSNDMVTACATKHRSGPMTHQNPKPQDAQNESQRVILCSPSQEAPEREIGNHHQFIVSRRPHVDPAPAVAHGDGLALVPEHDSCPPLAHALFRTWRRTRPDLDRDCYVNPKLCKECGGLFVPATDDETHCPECKAKKAGKTDPVAFTALLDVRRTLADAAIAYGKSWTEEDETFTDRRQDYLTAFEAMDALLLETVTRGVALQ